MRHKPDKFKLQEKDVADPTSDDGWQQVWTVVPHPYYRREVLLARAGRRDVQTRITWWCEYYA